MKKWFVTLIIFITLLGCQTGHAYSDPFVHVRGKSFILKGKPYYYLGTNMWYGALLGMKEKPGNRKRLKRELNFLKSIGINNLRIMGASEGTIYSNTVKPAFQPESGKYDERVLEGLDYLLSEMAKREMKAVIYLGNNWIWTGGFAQYVGWATGEKVPNPFLKKYSWDDFMNFSARFYTNKKAKSTYKSYIRMLINRVNTCTGKAYKNDPVIMAWQLANEPRPGRGRPGKKNMKAFSQWILNTAEFIKSMDSNHLVSTGSEGLAGCMGSAKLYKKINASKDIDYLTVHLWILNWGWFNPEKAEKTYPEAELKASDYLNKHIRFAEQLNKPIVLEEFGIPRDGQSYSPESTTIYRDKYFKTIFELIYENAKNKGPFAGSNFWTWGGEGRPSGSDSAKWKPGDPFTGDPPQEPQGRNSVFNSDTSTLKIIKLYAGKMNNLSR
ncbi:cellulase [bacterium BMS3Abin05]|nr:cellulase [bacterium BMS3Abin05]